MSENNVSREPMTDERLAEIRDLRVDSTSGDAPYNPDVWTLDAARRELVAEVDRQRHELCRVQEEANTSLRALAVGIRELHYVHPANVGNPDPERQYCEQDMRSWPCPTYRLVASLIEPTSGRAT